MPEATGPSAPAWEFHRSMPGYQPTPLLPVPDLAQRWRVGSVWVKEESHRLGLGAFKVLGASWAVNRALSVAAGHDAASTFEQLRDRVDGSGAHTLVTATDGNHGRAVAHMARLLGLSARIYVAGGLSDATLGAIADEGARVSDTGATYDEAVAMAAAQTGEREFLIQDTAWEGYEQVPGWIVEGYSTLFAEIDAHIPESVDVLAVPTGVGSLLQAALSHYREGVADSVAGARVLAVEPATAACVTASLAAGHPVSVDTSAPTAMAGLNCGTVSTLAWPVIRDGLHAAIGVTEAETRAAQRTLHDHGLMVGACGAASFAGIEAVINQPWGPAALALNSTSHVVLLSTEGII